MGGTAVQRNDLSKMEKKKSGVIDKARKEKNEPSLNEESIPPYFVVFSRLDSSFSYFSPSPRSSRQGKRNYTNEF